MKCKFERLPSRPSTNALAYVHASMNACISFVFARLCVWCVYERACVRGCIHLFVYVFVCVIILLSSSSLLSSPSCRGDLVVVVDVIVVVVCCLL